MTLKDLVAHNIRNSQENGYYVDLTQVTAAELADDMCDCTDIEGSHPREEVLAVVREYLESHS